MEQFALDLNRRLAGEGAFVWSPYSVASALTLAAAGARGRTYDELAGVLPAAPGERGLAEAAALDDAEIAVADTLWVREGLPIEQEYERATGAALHSADFAGDAEGVRQTINAEVAKATRELIRDLLPAGAVAPSTSAILVNALYLKAAWLIPFGRRDTVPAPFHGPSGRRRVPTMRRTGRVPYAEAGGWRMVTLAAAGDVVADVLLGPEDGPPAPEALAPLYAAARPVKVELSLPRFRVESSANLTEPLRAVGVRTAFTDDADFSGMTPEPVRIDRMEHKAVLEVDEQGLEGAAATAAVMVPAGMDLSRPVEFRVDRPFCVVVRHRPTGAVYFLARVTEP
jgi:serine protease inhibitor